MAARPARARSASLDSRLMDTASLAFTAVFCTLLVLGLLTRTVLASRQIRHVARHRDQVPAPFDATIPLDAHRKAADYTIAKTRLGLIDTAFEATVLIAWTLLGGLDWLNQALLGWLGGGMVQQLALLASFAVIGGLAGLPLSPRLAHLTAVAADAGDAVLKGVARRLQTVGLSHLPLPGRGAASPCAGTFSGAGSLSSSTSIP